MEFLKKSLGQNFLIDKNIINKIINLSEIKKKNIIEIGPGNGALTDEILKREPNSLTLIEKDIKLFKKLKEKHIFNKKVKILNRDILKVSLENLIPKNSIVFGNLPYNISSQILVKFTKLKKWPGNIKELIFMFQKEVGEKIISHKPSKTYGRISILTNLRFSIINNFLVSPNCFFLKPKVNSMVIHFQPKKNNYKIKNIQNLEKITSIFFSNKRKMIRKNLEKVLNNKNIKKLSYLDLSLRPAELNPDIYFKITELYECS